AFVWLPRDELNTERRLAVADLLEEATGRPVTSWSIELGEGDLALIRYTLDIERTDPTPDVKVLNRQLDAMVRGWEPSVEEALIARVGAGRATRLTLTYAGRFPDFYRNRTSPTEAAEDILRLQRLADASDRDARFFRHPDDTDRQLRLKIYRQGLIPLSEVVPVLENFGFRVLAEFPIELEGDTKLHIHACLLEMSDHGSVDDVMNRAEIIEQAIADVLRGRGENDGFNQLVLYAGLDPRPVVWLRAWFRYMRQTGVAFSIATVVDALRRAPKATGALVRLFTATTTPRAPPAAMLRSSMPRPTLTMLCRKCAGSTTTASFARCAQSSVQRFAPMPLLRRRPKRWHSRSTASRYRACRRRCPIAKSGCTARGSRASTCVAARSLVAACAGPTGATTSAPKSSA